MIGLIRHLAWSDIRSQRLPLLLWAGLLAVQAVVLLVDPLPQARLLTGPWSPALRYLVTAFLAAVIIQRDSLVGTTAFWRTRPIPRPALFASKMVSLTTILVILPWLVVFVTFESLGMLVADAMRAATAVAVEQAVVTLLAVMAACVTSSLTHLVVAGVAGSTLVTVFNAILLPAILTTWPFVGQSMGGGRPVVYIVTLFALGLPAIAHHYLTLREWRTAAMVAFALLAATAVTRAWPEDVSAVVDHAVDRTAVNPEVIAVTIDPETMIATDVTEEAAGVVVPGTDYSGALTVDGQPDGVLLAPVAIDSRLLLSDQTLSFRSQQRGAGMAMAQSRIRRTVSHRALQSALGLSVQLFEPLGLQFERAVDRVRLMSVPADVAERHAGQRAILTADVTFRAHRFRVQHVIPARRGARFAVPGSAFEVISAAASINGATVVLREAEVRADDQFPSVMGTFTTFVLRNTARHEAFELHRGSFGASAELMLRFLRTGAIVFSYTWQVPASRDAAEQRINQAWLADAELVGLTLEDLGTFERLLQAELTVKK